jgi:hypothetical protein
MKSSALLDLDLIEELKLRRWAREHYVPDNQREKAWHPIVHDEMVKKDHEDPDPRTTAVHTWMKS